MGFMCNALRSLAGKMSGSTQKDGQDITILRFHQAYRRVVLLLHSIRGVLYSSSSCPPLCSSQQCPSKRVQGPQG